MVKESSCGSLDMLEQWGARIMLDADILDSGIMQKRVIVRSLRKQV